MAHSLGEDGEDEEEEEDQERHTNYLMEVRLLRGFGRIKWPDGESTVKSLALVTPVFCRWRAVASCVVLWFLLCFLWWLLFLFLFFVLLPRVGGHDVHCG